MKLALSLLVLLSIQTCESLDSKLLRDPRYCNGIDFVSRKVIQPKIQHSGKYTIVTGYAQPNGSAGLGLYYRDEELLSQSLQEGLYDTVIALKLNHDQVPDFLILYSFEEGTVYSAIISESETTFTETQTIKRYNHSSTLSETDSLEEIIPLSIRDLDHDGLDDLVLLTARFNGKEVAISITDTVFGNQWAQVQK